jgi:threonyl-tRNA synthetase
MLSTCLFTETLFFNNPLSFILFTMIKITFLDGSSREYKPGITPIQIAQQISVRLAKDIKTAIVNGIPWKLEQAIYEDSSLELHK